MWMIILSFIAIEDSMKHWIIKTDVCVSKKYKIKSEKEEGFLDFAIVI